MEALLANLSHGLESGIRPNDLKYSHMLQGASMHGVHVPEKHSSLVGMGCDIGGRGWGGPPWGTER
jgi:hypothetical protein